MVSCRFSLKPIHWDYILDSFPHSILGWQMCAAQKWIKMIVWIWHIYRSIDADIVWILQVSLDVVKRISKFWERLIVSYWFSLKSSQFFTMSSTKELQRRERCHAASAMSGSGASLLQMMRLPPEAPAELKRAHLKEAVMALKQLVQDDGKTTGRFKMSI